MGIVNFAKKTVRDNTNVKAWVGSAFLKQSTANLRDMYRDLFNQTFDQPKSDPSQRPSNFAEAMQRYGVTEEDLQKRMRTCLYLLKIYAVSALALLIYMGYLFTHQHATEGLFVVLLILILASFMFKEHFTYFQMKQRRLGCTVLEWLKALVGGSN